MKRTRWLGAALLLILALGQEARAVEYGVGSWEATRLGNQRAVVRVAAAADAVRANLPWRRRDASPEKKAVGVTDASGQRVANVLALNVTREAGDIIFQPTAGAGTYYVYLMPYTTSGEWYFPKVEYVAPEGQPDAAWLQRNRLTEGETWRALPLAELVRFEACSAFHRRDPMELVATAEETRTLLAKHPNEPLLLFPETREHPIRMTDDLPQCWAERGASGELVASAQRNEYFVFQVGAYAPQRELKHLQVRFSALKSAGSAFIPAAALTCFNVEGTDWLGRPIRKDLGIAPGKVQALWCGLHVPADLPPATYRGMVNVSAEGVPVSSVAIALRVGATVLEDEGVGDLDRLARLKWLNSTIGLDEQPTAPYTPLQIAGQQVACLGREVRFGDDGFLSSIRAGRQEILAGPLGMTVETADGPAPWRGKAARIVHRASGAVAWETTRKAGALSLACRAKMESDGYLNYIVTLDATAPTELRDVRLDIPLKREIATYMMGLGKRGGIRPAEWKWDWKARQANHMVWIGDVHAGLQCKLKGPNDEWNLWGVEAGAVRNWGNDGKGGATVTEHGETVLLRAFTGPRQMAAGEHLEFRFGLLITPVKPLDPEHWRWRYIHEYNTVPAVKDVVADGANIINIHQGNEHNPYINYPFLTTDLMKQYTSAAHEQGLKVKIYYTVRELSNFTKELFALRSHGHEVFYGGGGGGGDSWLQEHLVSDYGPAWHQPYANGEVDAAIGTVGLSRWHNYYLEGLGWLIRNVGIDGLYLDGIGYDREIMKRVRKVMDRARPGCLMDFHSGNGLNDDGTGSSPANLYMEHFPYIDSLWFGEMYDYNSSPDYWLVEISGIPFGLYGEMLQGGGNPWRGMLYGMTNRLHWQGDPRALWKLWDEFGLQDARMIGYWEKNCPVRTDQKDVLATVYQKPGRSLISLASWAPGKASCRLTVDWAALGLDPAKASFYAPEIQGFQPERVYKPGDAIPIPRGRGWLFRVDEQPHAVPPQVDAYTSRRLIMEDDFRREALGEPWTTSLSERGQATLALRDGAIGIKAMDNCYAFAERPLPPGATLVQCRVDSGSDAGATWGPGLTVLWEGGKVVRVNVRSMGTFGVDDGADFVFPGRTGSHESYWLRVRLEAAEVAVEASVDGEYWDVLQRIPRERFPGSPTAVRLGKGGPGGRAEDFANMARAGECALGELRVYGPKAP